MREEDVGADLEAVERDLAEQRRLAERLERGRAGVTAAETEVASARARLVEETADVARLESFSPTRIWAGLRGSREVDLDRERAEQQAAQYAVAQAEARLARATAEVAATTTALQALGDPAARRREVLAAKEAWLTTTGHALAEELQEIARETGTARSQLAEVQEAAAAADTALARLQEASRLLSSARSWSSYDTFFGGGLVTDMVKYDRMDQAQRLMEGADAALRRLSTELADVGMGPVGGVAVTDLVRTFDVWFDNVFSDWSVRNRITEAADRVVGAGHAVAQVREQLLGRWRELDARLGQLAARREQLLSAEHHG